MDACMQVPPHGRLSGRSLIRSDELGLALSKLAHAIAFYFDFGCLLIIDVYDDVFPPTCRNSSTLE